MHWKEAIISYTEFPEARAARIDSTFFTATDPGEIAAWEASHAVLIPEALRSFMLFSNGLEAKRGEIWPIHPLSEWELLPKGCTLANDWIRFGRTREFRYCISLGHSPSIYRHKIHGSEPEFFTASLSLYLQKVFRNQA